MGMTEDRPRYGRYSLRILEVCESLNLHSRMSGPLLSEAEFEARSEWLRARLNEWEKETDWGTTVFADYDKAVKALAEVAVRLRF